MTLTLFVFATLIVALLAEGPVEYMLCGGAIVFMITEVIMRWQTRERGQKCS